MDWGRLKPDYPRAYWDKESQQQTDKPIKYESPACISHKLQAFDRAEGKELSI
ncbi:DNA primase (plasmid) [Nostoc flagelliforme CCNUN1]|uniref:DNA primase n=1 Tax=Nostoc flagelliforme CCNUN1 TaxID=2038116 RepID=A0A2K8T822_9NOSO|nr:DNA primase [Nostoc flagelliforme CCNUN1]